MKVGRHAAGGTWREGGGGREVAGGRWREGGGGRRAGIIHTACGKRRAAPGAPAGARGRRSALQVGCPSAVSARAAAAHAPPARQGQCSRSHAGCRRRRAAAAPIGVRRAEALSSVRRAATPFGVRRAATPVIARRAAALAGGRRAEAVGRAKPGLFSRSTVAVLERGTAAAGPEGAGARRSAAAEAIDVARGL